MASSNGSSAGTDAGNGHRRMADELSRISAAPPDPEVQERLLDLIVDALGVAVAGAGTPVGARIQDLFGSSPQPWDTALTLGTRMHALDFDDTHEPSLCHTAAALLPALISLAVDRGLSGAALLSAYDLGLRVVSVLSPVGPAINALGVHSTGIVGGLASGAACAWLLTLDPECAADAVEIAALMVSGLGAAFGTDCKPIQAGHAAEVGVRSALLAESGIGCPRDAPFGERGLLRLWLGSDPPSPRWGTDTAAAAFEVAVKPYPACFLTHGTIDNVLELRPQLGPGSADSIVRVEVAVNPIAKTLADKTALLSSNDAKFSLRFCALAALTDGEVVVGSFSDAAQRRLSGGAEEWSGWSERWEVSAEPRVPVVASELRLHIRDGRTLSASTSAQRGSPDRPLSRQEIVRKFRSNCSAALGDEAAGRLLDEIWELPATPDIAGCGAIARVCGAGAHWSRTGPLAATAE